MKFHPATELMWANQGSVKCTVLVMVRVSMKHIEIRALK